MICDHGIFFLYLIVDFLFLNEYKFELKAWKPLFLVMFGYFIFNGIYSLSIKPIYEIFDYRSSFSYIGSVIAIGLALISHLIGYYYFNNLKDICKKKYIDMKKGTNKMK